MHNPRCPKCGRRGEYRGGFPSATTTMFCVTCDMAWDPAKEGWEPLAILASLIQIPEAERDKHWWDNIRRLEAWLERGGEHGD